MEVGAIRAIRAGQEICDFANECGPGSVCAEPEVTPACAGPVGCCAPTCDLGGGACPDVATECAPWYGPGDAPPGLELTGICAASPVPPVAGWLPNRFLTADPGA